MKTTFDLNLGLNQALNSMDIQKHRNREKLSIKKVSLITSKLKIRKKLVNNKTSIKKSSSLY